MPTLTASRHLDSLRCWYMLGYIPRITNAPLARLSFQLLAYCSAGTGQPTLVISPLRALMCV
jgi:hypothetical protein